MIQRIQTVYLLLIVVAAVVLLWLPVLSFETPDDAPVQRITELSAIHGLKDVLVLSHSIESEAEPLTLKGTWGLGVANGLIALLALVDIFLFRKRLLQARLNIFLACLCIGYYGILAIYVWFMRMNFDMDWNILPYASIPLVCLVLTLMATRAILRDEALVRAADRIR